MPSSEAEAANAAPTVGAWSRIARSDELGAGEKRSVRCFDREILLFRGDDGVARAVEAHCPHLGAHLGVGGSVVDGCIRCPFHGWRFDGAGRCADIPYAKKIPRAARLASFPVVERDGAIFVGRSAEGRDPAPRLHGIRRKDGRARGASASAAREGVTGSAGRQADAGAVTRRFPFSSAPSSWYHLAWSDEVPRGRELRVRAFGTDLAVARDRDGAASVVDRGRAGRELPVSEKNGMIFAYRADGDGAPTFELPDIPEVASRGWLPIGRLDLHYRSHIQEVVENSVDLAHFQPLHNFSGQARLVRFETRAETFSVTVAAPKRVFGLPLPTELTISYHGMGLAIGRTERPFPFLSLVTCLPIEGDRLRQRLTMFVKAPRIPVAAPIVAALLRRHVQRDLADEIAVLEHKRYLDRPLLVAGDGPIMKVRAWCRQFYPPPAA